MSQFILMLTRNDVTVANALEQLDDVLGTDVQHIGFKDIGLDHGGMRRLVNRVHAAGRRVHLEVVSLSEADELRSAQVAIDLGVDYLIGGTRWQLVGPMLAGTQIRYFPYVGQVVGHPAELHGTMEAILAEIAAMTGAVDGVNLLAYRHVSLPADELLRAAVQAAALPVICAGSIDSLDRIRTVAAAGTWAFTIGAAALDGKLATGQPLTAQLTHALAAAGSATVAEHPLTTQPVRPVPNSPA